LPRLVLDSGPLMSASHVAGTKDVYHHMTTVR
jgi:hypothetical protein